jgi:hypothetical protein
MASQNRRYFCVTRASTSAHCEAGGLLVQRNNTCALGEPVPAIAWWNLKLIPRGFLRIGWGPPVPALLRDGPRELLLLLQFHRSGFVSTGELDDEEP